MSLRYPDLQQRPGPLPVTTLVATGLALVLVACGPTKSEPVDAGGAQADTWGNYAQGFFQTYCVTCHRPGGPYAGLQDFRQYATVQKWADHIRCGVAATRDASWGCLERLRQFPLGDGPHPSDAERDRLAAWITAGLPE